MADNKRRQTSSEEESAGGGEWLTTYSDMITNLLTFFVLLFAISNVDAQKFALLSKALSRDGISAEEFLDIKEKYNISGVGEPDPDDLQYPGSEDEKSDNSDSPDGEGEGESDTALGDLHELIMSYIIENQLEHTIVVLYSGDQLLLTLTNDIWFHSGSAEVTAEMQNNASMLAQLLAQTQDEDEPFDIVVVGHTDNAPINTSKYPSNWELSLDRAAKFLHILINDSGLSPKYFSARGCGEEVPIASNDTPEGMQLNRRVEVMISQPKEQQEH